MTTQRSATDLERELGPLVDAIDELVSLAGEGDLAEDALAALARRSRSALGADAVLIAVAGPGHAPVVTDASPDLAPTELRRQTVLATASVEDPVVEGHPDELVDHDQPAATVTAVTAPGRLRRIVTDLPRRGHLRGTLTVCRRTAFAADEVELVMAFAALAGLVPVPARPRPEAALPVPHEGPDVVGRLFAVGIALELVRGLTDDDRLRRVVEEAVDQLDQAILDLRRAAFARHRAGTVQMVPGI